MENFEKVPAVLLLADGTAFYGFSAGKIGTTTGEICFNTGMTGYQEIFTDPSYFGQILVMTNAHIGNYGTYSEDVESENIKISGLAVKNFTNQFSRRMTTTTIQDYLLDEHLVAISDVDTRAIVRHIRSKGAMNCIISSETTDIEVLKTKLAETPDMNGLELASIVSTKTPYFIGNSTAEKKVLVYDFGVKKSILQNIADRGCYLKIVPANTPFEETTSFDANGYFISNGPGDPASMGYAVDTVKKILAADKPLFGICLGQQLLALANGVSTYKMHHGHRGCNHPVKNLETGLCEITTQNHGFSVREDELRANNNLEITHMNLNDQTVEGFRLKNKPAFSVQYHPEATPGPHDARYLFDQFVKSMHV
ncbi:MAG TPA: glutamine-hydrolyzing carbamoyl-phosphate synthase small subunit [Chitinophagales bacterium]|nr:glutamine-hydrolyzing carbamoyl-phosphate synthase small subunit [Chitinophagales bacterium]HMU70310.1 glutamine-hydrolyzing carbamoyl-phosphate synthase small subunit [Chitinophagales bacterium]HMX04238.1 glutamine-hydrolyzing carbamoyl-phosphate synthase small subunit [Chitinophagales bacterium]HMZ88675.1 glutamine-hydrolyzing carbamoyl-phosphate synthase small subunit [Chitinophagales bacterium]HNA58937.1 glutamine-hydrolyzing carbamoyl-phosphate synthase small subunit [Chitinophagales ba